MSCVLCYLICLPSFLCFQRVVGENVARMQGKGGEWEGSRKVWVKDLCLF
jgi:hypothetical protein